MTALLFILLWAPTTTTSLHPTVDPVVVERCHTERTRCANLSRGYLATNPGELANCAALVQQCREAGVADPDGVVRPPSYGK